MRELMENYQQNMSFEDNGITGQDCHLLILRTYHTQTFGSFFDSSCLIPITFAPVTLYFFLNQLKSLLLS